MLLAGTPVVGDAIALANQVSGLSPAQLFEIADRLKRAGRFAEAETAYRALAGNPAVTIRSEAKFRLAMMLSSLGRRREAAELLRQILDEQPGAQRARIELAGVLARLGRVADAQRELRGAQASGLPADMVRLLDRFSAALRARAPYGASIGFGLAPDSNINRGTQLDHLGTVFGDFLISKDAKRRSGVGLTVDGEAFVRKPVTDRVSLLAKGAISARLYRRGAFDDVTIAPSIGPEIALGADRLSLSAVRSRRWFGGERYIDSVGIEMNFEHPLKSRAVLRSAVAAHHVDNHMNDLEDGTHVFVSSGGELALNSRSGIGMNWTVVRRGLRDAGYSNWSVYPAIYGWRDAGRLTLSASVTAGRLWADDRLVIYPAKRKDRYLRVALGAVARHLTIGGFAPSLQLSFERNRSSIGVYDYHRRAAELGVSRAF